MFRTAFRLRWIPRHVLVIAAVTVLSLLGRWQWDVSESQRGSLQNLLYAFQWWVMAAMVIYGWWRLLRDDAHPRARDESAATPAAGVPAAVGAGTAEGDSWAWQPTAAVETATAGPTPAQLDAEVDPELAEYNEYLTWLNNRAERTARQAR